MLMTSVIAALRAFAKRLLHGARKRRSPGSATVSKQSPESAWEGPDHAGSDQEKQQASSIPGQTQGDRDGHSGDPAAEPLDDNRHSNESSTTPPEAAPDAGHPEPRPPLSRSDSDRRLPPRSPEVEPNESSTVAPPNDDIEPEQRDEPNTGEPREDGEPDGIPEHNRGAANTGKPRRTPRRIGPKRGQRSSNPGSERQQPSPSRPELVCRKRAGSATWDVILAADKQCQIAAVHLDGELLHSTGREWYIPSLNGTVAVRRQDGGEDKFPLFKGNPLIFKLRKNWVGEGRKIDRITSGHFIIIVPSEWERNGHAPVEVDDCADPEFRAHYFYRGATVSAGGFDAFDEWSNTPLATGIELVGRRIFDDSNDGELFVGAPPSLKPSASIEWVRVGEEAENGWEGKNFLLTDEQDLPKVLGDRDGRFFLRVYDSEVRLLDSVAFRRLSNLRQIHVDGAEYTEHTALAPMSTGYSPTEIRFIGAEGSTLSPILPPQAPQVAAESGAINIPPHPDADRISCSLASEAQGVNIVLDLPRLWWRLEDGRPDHGEWRDTPLVMTREEFRQHAYTNVSMSIMSRRFDSVRAGFDEQLQQTYQRTAEDGQIAIPLAHFVDHAQIDRRLNRDAHFNIEWAQETVPLIVVSADPIPKIVSFTADPTRIVVGEEATLKWTTQNADDARVTMDPDAGPLKSAGSYAVRPTESTRYTLTVATSGTHDVSRTVTVTINSPRGLRERLAPRVLSHTGAWRGGKGFSSGELRDAGMSVKEAAERSIPIDTRRRTSHRANVDTIRSVLDD